MAVKEVDMRNVQLEYFGDLKSVRIDADGASSGRFIGVATGKNAAILFEGVANRLASAIPDSHVKLKVDGFKIVNDQS